MKTPFTFSPYLPINRRGSNSTTADLFPPLLKIFRLLVFLSSISLFHPSPAQAQTISLSLWPPIIEITTQPGQIIRQNYRLKNSADDTTIRTALIPFEPADQLGHIQLSTQGYQSPALSYFSLQGNKLPTSFPLKAGETKDLTLTINIPSTASPTDHYLTLLFQADTQGLISGTGSRTLGAVGSNILLNISSTDQPQPTARIKQFSLHRPVLDSFDPIQFTLLLKNTSPTYLKAVGHINIHSSLSRKTTTLPLRSDNLLANSTRQLVPEQSWHPLFPFGRYTATAVITPQNTTDTISQTISFWIIPYKGLLTIIIIFLLYRLSKTLPKYIRKYQKYLPKPLRF
jgi:hypothetical protein